MGILQIQQHTADWTWTRANAGLMINNRDRDSFSFCMFHLTDTNDSFNSPCATWHQKPHIKSWLNDMSRLIIKVFYNVLERLVNLSFANIHNSFQDPPAWLCIKCSYAYKNAIRRKVKGLYLYIYIYLLDAFLLSMCEPLGMKLKL